MTDGPVPAVGTTRANPLLAAFMDADRDGDVDLADTLRMAGRFMNR